MPPLQVNTDKPMWGSQAYTGLHDEEDNEIFEGDIVNWWWEAEGKYGPDAVVMWDTRSIITNDDVDPQISGWFVEDCPLDGTCVVVGNIIENKYKYQ